MHCGSAAHVGRCGHASAVPRQEFQINQLRSHTHHPLCAILDHCTNSFMIIDTHIPVEKLFSCVGGEAQPGMYLAIHVGRPKKRIHDDLTQGTKPAPPSFRCQAQTAAFVRQGWGERPAKRPHRASATCGSCPQDSHPPKLCMRQPETRWRLKHPL